MGETHLLGSLHWGLDVGVLLRLRGWVMMHHMWRVELLLLLLIPVGPVSTAAAPHDRPVDITARLPPVNALGSLLGRLCYHCQVGRGYEPVCSGNSKLRSCSGLHSEGCFSGK